MEREIDLEKLDKETISEMEIRHFREREELSRLQRKQLQELYSDVT